MVLNKFLNGLPVLGLLALLACPVTDATDGVQKDESGKPIDLSAKVTALETKVSNMMSKDEILKEIAGIGDVDPTKPKQVFGKLVQIMKDAQPAGCHAFYAPNVQYPAGPTVAKVIKSIIRNGQGGGTLTITPTIANGAAGWPYAANDKFEYEYKDYSVDGKYKLGGTFTLISKGVWAKADAAKGPYHALALGDNLEVATTEAVSTLTLTGEGLPTAGIAFTIPKDFGITPANAAADTATTCPTTFKEDIKITTKIGGADVAMEGPLFKYLMSGK